MTVIEGRNPDPRVVLLSVGFAAFAVSDVFFLFESAQNIYVEGGILDLGWPFAAVLIGVAASMKCADVSVRRRIAAPIWLPMTATVAAIGVLAAQAAFRVPEPAVFAAVTTLLLAMVRVTFAFRELRNLATARSEARTDDLTGMPNRRAFFEQTETLLLKPAIGNTATVLLLDLDGFKLVNDTLGHPAGDEVLRQTAARIVAAVRPQDLIARIGGDEFVIVVDGGPAAADAVRKRIHAQFTKPFLLGAHTLNVHASVGTSSWPSQGTDIDALIHVADLALYADKRARQASPAESSSMMVDETRAGRRASSLNVVKSTPPEPVSP